MDRSDWALLAIAGSPDKRLSPVQIQKTLFLLGKNRPRDVGKAFYSFRPYNYGPFDGHIYDDLRMLCFEGYVRRVKATDTLTEFELTPRGASAARTRAKKAPPRARAYLDKAARWARSVTFAHLVRSIYKLYPEYRENSVFQG
ncbi:MAG TPA: hypothetical protein VEV38_09340 [Candidatus Eremiobacteraceae bacterium]|nr:hypothetical protein [Candidatus Eremiobacteraceae bacterium]